MLRRNLSLVLYFLALAITTVGTFFIIAIHWRALLAGKGIGSFGSVFMVLYMLATFILWSIGWALQRRRKLDIAYWLLTAIPLAMLILLPVHF